MESLKNRLEQYKMPEISTPERRIQNWQSYALEVIKEFGIQKPYQSMIFRYCKQNTEYVKGKVANAKEKFGTQKLEDKGNYLISLFRSKKPW